MKGDIAQRRQLRAVGKTDISKYNLSPHLPFKFSPALRFCWFVNNFKDALTRGASGLDQLVELMEFTHRFVEKTGQQKKGAKIAQFDRPGENILRSNRNDQKDPERTEQVHRRVVQRPDSHHHQSSAPQFVAHFVKTGMLFAFPHETLNLPNARKIIVQKGVHGRRSAALQSITPMGGERVPQSASGQKWHRSQSDECEFWAQIKHSREHNDDLQNCHRSLLNSVDENALDRSYVF